MNRINCKRSNVVLAISALVATLAAQRAAAADEAPAQPAQAQAQAAAPAAPAASSAKPEKDITLGQTVVISGSVVPHSKIDVGRAATALEAEQVKDIAPSSTADILKVAPGVFVETTGGESGANIRVRGFPEDGDSPYATFLLNGAPLYASPSLSFLEGSSLFRFDDMITGVDIQRGGSGPIFGTGQPGLTVDFAQRRGTEDDEGDIRLTTGTGNLRRIDGYYAGKLSDKWTIALGGFYRSTNGVRDNQFPSDRGGQFSATLTRKLDGGSLNLYSRVLSDDNTFYTDVPLMSSNHGHSISAYPGIDPRTASFYSDEVRRVSFEVTPGSTPGTAEADMGRGRGPQANTFGIDFDKKIDGWKLASKSSFTSADTPTNALFSGPVPTTLGAWIAKKVATVNADANIVTAAGGMATGAAVGGVTFAGDHSAITDLNQGVIEMMPWTVDKRLRSFSEEASVTREIFAGNTLSLGTYFSTYSSHDLWYLGNEVLMTLHTNPRLIDVTLDNGVQLTRAGVESKAFNYDVNADWEGRNAAVYIADEWKLTDKLRLDSGVRFENQHLDGRNENFSVGDLDANPLTQYDNANSYFNGSFTTYHDVKSRPSWTLGANYSLTPSTSVYARANSGVHLPSFDDLRNGHHGVESIRQFELGLNSATKLYTAFLTIYTNQLRNSQFQAFQLDNGLVTYPANSRSTGLEFETALRPVSWFDVTFEGDYAKGHYFGSGNISGNSVQRMPGVETRLTPQFKLRAGDTSVRLFGTWTHVGDRYSDPSNTQLLPKYDTFDLGAVAEFSNGVEVRLAVNNATNTLGLTEGNPRVQAGNVDTDGAFMARPLFGRNYQLSVGYSF